MSKGRNASKKVGNHWNRATRPRNRSLTVWESTFFICKHLHITFCVARWAKQQSG